MICNISTEDIAIQPFKMLFIVHKDCQVLESNKIQFWLNFSVWEYMANSPTLPVQVIRTVCRTTSVFQQKCFRSSTDLLGPTKVIERCHQGGGIAGHFLPQDAASSRQHPGPSNRYSATLEPRRIGRAC